MANTVAFKTGYKATNKDMTCRGFRFELGKWYSAEGELDLCENGFHFCEHPSGPWAYYSNGRLFNIEAKEVLVSIGPGADLKHVARHIRLVKEIKIDGDENTGYRNTGHRNTGDGNAGSGNAGSRNTGYRNTGDGNTGYRNTGDENACSGNTGDGNAGSGNTGYGNAGDENAGYRNTGYGNCGNDHSGSLCFGEAPFYLFNKKAAREKTDFSLVRELSRLLLLDGPISPTPFLSLPNATKTAIKKLHAEHIKARNYAASRAAT